MTKNREFDSARYLNSQEDIAEYLSAILEEGEPKLLPYALGQVARAQGMSKLAKITGLKRESLYQSLSKNGNPSFAMVMKIFQAFNVKLGVQANDNQIKPHERRKRK